MQQKPGTLSEQLCYEGASEEEHVKVPLDKNHSVDVVLFNCLVLNHIKSDSQS